MLAPYLRQILPPRRVSPPPRPILRRPKHCLRLFRAPCLWGFPDQDRDPCRLALSLHRGRLLHNRVLSLCFLVPPTVCFACAFSLERGERSGLLPHADGQLLHCQRKVQPQRLASYLQTAHKLAHTRHRDMPGCSFAIRATFLASNHWQIGFWNRQDQLVYGCP